MLWFFYLYGGGKTMVSTSQGEWQHENALCCVPLVPWGEC